MSANQANQTNQTNRVVISGMQGLPVPCIGQAHPLAKLGEHGRVTDQQKLNSRSQKNDTGVFSPAFDDDVMGRVCFHTREDDWGLWHRGRVTDLRVERTRTRTRSYIRVHDTARHDMTWHDMARHDMHTDVGGRRRRSGREGMSIASGLGKDDAISGQQQT